MEFSQQFLLWFILQREASTFALNKAMVLADVQHWSANLITKKKKKKKVINQLHYLIMDGTIFPPKVNFPVIYYFIIINSWRTYTRISLISLIIMQVGSNNA